MNAESFKAALATLVSTAALVLAPSLCVAQAESTTGFAEAYGSQFRATDRAPAIPRRRLPRDASLSAWLDQWHGIAIDTTGLDHTPTVAGDVRRFGEQLGPGRSSRAMAIVHVAMFEALNAGDPGRYRSMIGLTRGGQDPSLRAALAQAAHDTLVALFPSHAARLDAQLAEDLASLADPRGRDAGTDLGRRAAQAILSMRAGDGTDRAEPVVGIGYVPDAGPGVWRPDPVSRIPLAIGAFWSEVRPFAIASASIHRVRPPPRLDSAAFATAFDEVQRLGGDGIATPTERSAEQTRIGIYWAYDGTPSLCAPPRLYNQIAHALAHQRNLDVLETARLLALVNLSMADAGIAAWESKYHYAVWRPVTAIREADSGSGPSGLGDGNDATRGDPNFSPLGAPASNLAGPNFTPPFPAYPSGHAVFGAALFETLRLLLGTDSVAFTFVSDELNGVTSGADGVVRPRVSRRFSSLSQAEEENGQSRIYLGIHWAFDKTAGIAQGRAVARDVARLWYPSPERRRGR